MNEDDLMKDFRLGSQEAFKIIFDRFNKGLWYFADQMIKDSDEAEDIVAETFIKVHSRVAHFQTLPQLKSYLYVVVKNNCLNHLKRVKMKENSHTEIFYLSEKDDSLLQTLQIKADLISDIMKEVENLPPDRKRIFKMIFIDGLSTKEIATQLNISIDTVRVQKARAIQSLRTTFLKDKLLLAAFMLFISKWPQ